MRMSEVEDEVSKKMDYYADYIDLMLKHCQSREDLLMVGSLMMSYSSKIFAACFQNEEVARTFMMDCLETKIHPESLKKVV